MEFESAVSLLFEKAEWSAQHRQIEADLRSDLFTVLAPYAEQVVRIRPEDIRQEGTGLQGRFDSMFGRAIIEYKRPGLLDSLSEQREAALQGLRYLEDETLGAQLVIITDGKTWGFLRDPQAGPEPGEQAWLFEEADVASADPVERYAWRGNSEAAARRVLVLLDTLKSVPVTVNSVKARLGLKRPEVLNLVTILASQLDKRTPGDRSDILFRQWIQLAGVAYGISNPDEGFPTSAESMLGDPLATIVAPVGYPGSIFVLHSYVTLASKLLACELLALTQGKRDLQPSQWVALSRRDFAQQLVALEGGRLTNDLKAPGMLVGDLFGWWTPLVADDDECAEAIRGVINALSELAWARVANAGGMAVDLLRALYQEVVPAPVRKSLGEFFTPRWVAERVLLKALEHAELPNDRSPRILDPACGSGTFLVAALRYGLRQLTAAGRSEEPEAIEELISGTIGFDINPVAPLMTKVSLLLALGDRVSLIPELDLRVYQADSILLPEIAAGQSTLYGPSIPTHVLPLEIGEIALPQALATLEGVALVRDHIDISIANRRSSKTFAARLKADLENRKMVEEGEIEESVRLVTEIFDRLAGLAKEGKNGVWSHVIEQSFAPRAVGKVDVVVGNPPWISWKVLPDRWKDRSERTWRQWGLWQTSGKSVPLSDVSTLLLARSLATYSPEGTVAFLLPRSVLISDPSGTKIRLCQLSPDPSYGGGVGGALNFRPVYVDDFSSVRPFSPDAANEPVALYLRAAEAPPAGSDFVFPFDRWYRRQARSRLSHTKSWAATEADDLNAESGLMGPIDPTDRASPWAPERRLSEVPLLSKIQQPAYRWGRGFETRGVDGILFVELDNPLPPSGHSPRTLTILTRPDLGKNTRHMTSYEAKIEPTLLWPLIKGSDVQPWRVRESGLYVIVAHDEEDPTRILTEEELIRVSGRLFDFLEPHLDMLRNRSLYRDRGAVGGPWGLSGPTEHLDAQAHVVMVRYIAAAGRPAAAVASPHVDPYLGRRTVSLPNNKTNVYFTRNEDEAYYLAGWVNSSPVQDALERFSAATGITPRALERLPVQRFDADDTNHVEVARLARVCTEKAQADDRAQLSEHWAQLDAVVAGMAGVETATLKPRTTAEVTAELSSEGHSPG